MKRIFQIKIILILLPMMCFFSTATAQLKGAKEKNSTLKKISPKSKKQLLKRLGSVSQFMLPEIMVMNV